MSYILLVDDEPDNLNILELILQASISIPAKKATSGNKAKRLIEDHGHPLLIICDYRMPDGDGITLYDFWLESKSTSLFYICSGNPIDELFQVFPKASKILTKPECFLTLEPLLINQFGAPSNIQKFVDVPLDLFVKLGIVEVDVYLKLSDEKYVKVLSKGEVFDRHDRAKYQNKLITHLSVTNEDAHKLLSYFESIFKQKMRESESSAVSIEFGKDALETTVALSKILGWSEDTVRIAKTSIELTIQVLALEPSWDSILSKASSDSRYASHISLIALTSCSIAQNLGWSSESTKQKLVMAALLHDYLVEESMYDNIESAENDPFYKKHPVAIAEFARTLKGLSNDVDQILLQHHEKPNGKGFPRSLCAQQIAPLSALFILCEDLVTFFQNNEFTQASLDLFWKLHPDYLAKDPFKKIAQSMIKS
jgi:response regulator RpfG family c-di-GMP phosphodiesterase